MYSPATVLLPFMYRPVNVFTASYNVPSKHKAFHYNICTMLDQQRRWADVVQILYKCFVFAGFSCHSLTVRVDLHPLVFRPCTVDSLARVHLTHTRLHTVHRALVCVLIPIKIFDMSKTLRDPLRLRPETVIWRLLYDLQRSSAFCHLFMNVRQTKQ